MIKKIMILLITITICGAFVGYTEQRKEYARNIAYYLQSGCSTIIESDFQQHASMFDTKKTQDTVTLGTHSELDVFNNILQLDVEGRSIIYFNDFSPQEITCNASILPAYKAHRKITKETKILFVFTGPAHLPSNFKSTISSNRSFELTIDDINKMDPFADLFPLNKPQFHFFGIV